MIPGVDPAVDRACLFVASLIVSMLSAYAVGMWLLRGVVHPELFIASALCVAVLTADSLRRSTA